MHAVISSHHRRVVTVTADGPFHVLARTTTLIKAARRAGKGFLTTNSVLLVARAWDLESISLNWSYWTAQDENSARAGKGEAETRQSSDLPSHKTTLVALSNPISRAIS